MNLGIDQRALKACETCVELLFARQSFILGEAMGLIDKKKHFSPLPLPTP